MKLSWLASEVVSAARTALQAIHSDWEQHFTPEFTPPPAPVTIAAQQWPCIAEHVARAERVSAHVRAHGFDSTLAAFGDSRHAIELATVIAAAEISGGVSFDLLESLLTCQIDEFVLYGTFLTLLVSQEQPVAKILDLYERFCAAVQATESDLPSWPVRVAATMDGLACIYVRFGRHDAGHQLFEQRHEQDSGDVAVALSASRSFLASGEVGRAVDWLGRGADRARDLGRADMDQALRAKQNSLRKRLS